MFFSDFERVSNQLEREVIKQNNRADRQTTTEQSIEASSQSIGERRERPNNRRSRGGRYSELTRIERDSEYCDDRANRSVGVSVACVYVLFARPTDCDRHYHHHITTHHNTSQHITTHHITSDATKHIRSTNESVSGSVGSIEVQFSAACRVVLTITHSIPKACVR